MKKATLFASTLCTLMLMISCSDQPASNTHQHEDGTLHSDHAPDTVKPQQEEFVLGDTTAVDTTKKDSNHTHKNGKKHSH